MGHGVERIVRHGVITPELLNHNVLMLVVQHVGLVSRENVHGAVEGEHVPDTPLDLRAVQVRGVQGQGGDGQGEGPVHVQGTICNRPIPYTKDNPTLTDSLHFISFKTDLFYISRREVHVYWTRLTPPDGRYVVIKRN
jgi:hypothetical protein